MTQQIAVKLPDALLRDVDALIGSGAFDTRSHAVRSALETLVDVQRRRVIDEAFALGFAQYPETDDELADAERLAVESIEGEPWTPWW